MEREYRDRTPERRRRAGTPSAEADAWFLIDVGIEQAQDHARDIDDMTARIIAFNLAPTITSNLAYFAQTGGSGPHANNTALRDEYLPIYHHPETPDDIRKLIDWLGAYLIHRENPRPSPYAETPGAPLLRNLLWHTVVSVGDEPLDLHVRADQPSVVIRALPDALAPLIDREGDSMRAFLALPDVDASSPNLEESYYESYRGTFASREEALQALTELDQIEGEVDRIATTYAGGDCVTIDRDQLWARLNDLFELVPFGDGLHAFDK